MKAKFFRAVTSGSYGCTCTGCANHLIEKGTLCVVVLFLNDEGEPYEWAGDIICPICLAKEGFNGLQEYADSFLEDIEVEMPKEFELLERIDGFADL